MFLSDLYNNKLFENISPIDLAEVLFNSLMQKYPEAVTRFGHEVVGDAVIDYAEEADDIRSMSDVDMAVDEILQYLENYQGDRTNDLEPDSSAPVTENLRKWFKEKWVRFGPDGKIRGACARGDSSEGKPKCLPQAKAHALGKKGRKYAAAKKRREDPNPERSGAAINVATKKKSNEGVAEADLDEACWKGYHKEGMKTMFGKKYPNCVKNEDVAEAKGLSAAMRMAQALQKEKLKREREQELRKPFVDKLLKKPEDKKDKDVAEGSTTRGGFGGSASQAYHEIEWLKNKIETLKPLLAKKPSVARQIKDLERQIRERELAIAYQKEGVAESIHSPSATQYSGKPDAYTFSKVQQKHYNTLSSILARNGMKFTHIDARTYPARRSYLAPNRNDPKPFFLTSFIVKSPALEWIKYEGGTAGGGQNLVKINGKKMKLTEFLSLPPKQQDALLQAKPTVAVDTAPIWKVNFQWNTQGGQPIHSSTKTKADSKEKAIAKTIKKFKSRGIIISVISAEPVESPITENANNLSVQQLAAVSDAALDQAYGYGRSTPGNSFGWQANLQSAAYAKKMIDSGVTDIEAIADAIHKGWNTTALRFVQNPDQFDDTEKLRKAGKLDAKLQQRAKLMKISYAELDNNEQEKDRVVARALLQAITGQQGVAEGSLAEMDSQGYRGHRGDEDPGKGPEKVVKPAKTKDVKKDAEKTLTKALDQAHKKQGVAEGGFKNLYAEFSGYGNYMQGRAVNVFRKAGLEVVSKEYSEDDDIQTYVVKGDRWAIKKAGQFLERNPEQFGGYHFVKQGVAEGFNADAYDEEHYYRGHTKDKNGEFQPGPKFDSLGAAQKWRKETPGEHKVTLHRRQQDVAEGQQTCPECGGPAFSNLILAEKQDACYHKVKSRYKVWPSAYASGALVQCRKKGAANWGTKKKTNEATESPSQDYQKMMNFVQGQRLSGVPPEQQVAVALFKELEKTKAYNKELKSELQAAGERADIGAEQGEITSKELTKHRGELEKEKVKQQASKAQLQTLAQQLDQLKSTPDIDPEATSALERQIADLEQRMQNKQGTGVSADKIAELEKAIAAVQQGETVDAKAIEKLEQQFKDAEASAKTAQARVGQVKDYTAQIEKLNAEIDNLNSALANNVKPNIDNINQKNIEQDEFLTQIADLVGKSSMPNPNAKNLAKSISQMIRNPNPPTQQTPPQQAPVQQDLPLDYDQRQLFAETRFYFTPKATDTASLRNDFKMTQDSQGWYITESQGPAAVLEAQRAFGIPKIKEVKLKEVRISDFTGRAGTIGDENATSPIGSLPRKGRKYA